MTADHSVIETLQNENSLLRQQIATLEQTVVELRQSRHMLQLILDNLPLAVAWKDQELVYQGCNRQFARDAGLTSSTEIVGKSEFDLCGPDQAEHHRAVDRTVLTSGTPEYHREEAQNRGDESPAWLRVSRIPLADDGETPCTLLEVYEDITKSKEEKDWLRMFYTVVENAPDGFGVGSLDGRTIYANQAYYSMLGRDLLGSTFAEYIAPEDHQRIPEIMQQVQTTGIWQGRMTYQRTNGETFPAEVATFIARDHTEKPLAMVGIVRDLTEQLRIEEEQAAQQATLRELSTPLIPLADDLVAMPLIGSIDSARAQQILEALLQGVAQHQATTVIVDITGVQVVDTQIANVLVRAAQAVKLLGAQVVLTGIRPEVAQTLVGMGADIQGIITHGTLKSGIAYALEQNNAKDMSSKQLHKRTTGGTPDQKGNGSATTHDHLADRSPQTE
jgi:anti-anti-sigma factor